MVQFVERKQNALRTAILSAGIRVRIDGTFAGRVVTVMACAVSDTAANPTYRRGSTVADVSADELRI